MATSEEFFEKNQQEDGTLSPEAMAKLLVGDTADGDTLETSEESGKQPEPAATDDKTTDDPEQVVEPEKPTVDEPAADEKPVILAKDGKHTIEYEKLKEAREKANLYKEKAELQEEKINTLQETVDALMAAKEDPTDVAASQELVDALKDLEENDPDLYKAVHAMLDAKDRTFAEKIADLEDRFAKAIEPLQESTEDIAIATHYDEIIDAHDDFMDLMESGAIDEWVETQPAFMQVSMNQVLDNGTAQEVIDLFNVYKSTLPSEPVAEPKSEPEPPDKNEIAEKAAQAVQAAKDKRPVPTSLSEVPAGTKAHHDENEALLNMTAQNQMAKFNNMSASDILEKLSKVI